jgi:ferredoxin-NADP reductase
MEAVVRVLESRRETPTTHSVKVSKPQGFSFKAGQFAKVQIETPEGPDDRFLSIACSPTTPYLEFAVRQSESSFKHVFCGLKPGDELAVEGPSGKFILDEGRGPVVMLSGGIGITPLKSMAEHAAEAGVAREITLLYSSRTPDEIVFREQLDRLEKLNPRFRVIHTITDASGGGVPKRAWTGRIDERLMLEARVMSEDAVYYVCGPPGLVRALKELLRGMGVADARIRRESFTGYPSPQD